MLKALIIDDEPLAHEVIKHHIRKHPDIEVAGHCFHATEALHWLAEHSVDLIFLDINMPVLTGMEMLRVLHNKPQVIIVSAYQEYALEGYELDVTDYLVKPVSEARLSQALDKVRKRCQKSIPNAPSNPSIVVKVDREKRKIDINSILYLEAYGNYVKLWQNDTMLLVNSTLKQLVAELPDEQFIQVHKSFVVNTAVVIGVDSEHIRLKGEKRIKLGKVYKQTLNDLF
ncbi:DNA-binding response regulator [Alteromonas sediminis]|uniref:DNA-binding response regulator n=1 Tax=Alteromonas sediminis TaxID=2259342 RepID=A0A3N5Y784_9ALTE|nr:LytTR family DNA-binding domain-containing protein [Alteromonas sediminis]RPJ66569.1 DNA-binding response regulator [Alteromonas sediminis]